jgi:hypothetical protein
MSGPGHALRPRVARLVDGRYRAVVVIADLWGGENVFLGGVAASHDAALALARRLIATAAVEEPAMLELPAPWK